MQPLGNAVDEQIDDLELRQVAAGKPLVFGPQPRGDLADRGAAQQTLALGIGKQCLDIARRQPARVHLHRQCLQLGGAAAHELTNRRAERCGAIGNLRRAVFDPPFRAIQTSSPISVAVTGAGRRAAGVVLAPQHVARLALQRFLDDQPRREPDQLRGAGAFLGSFDHRLQLLARALGCRYSLHRGAPFAEAGPIPVLVDCQSGEGAPQPFSQQA